MQRIVITGGAGFIGSHLAEALVADGKEVFVIDDLSTGSLANIAALRDQPSFHFIQSSIRDSQELARVVDQVDFVYHLAAAARAGVGVLLTSTSEVYGKSERECFREDDDLLIGPPTFGRWSYACSKLLDEFLALAYWRERKLPIIVARLFNTVGQRQTGRYGMVLPRFVQAALRDEPITVHGDGKQTRCFCHVSDVVRALVALPRQERAVGQVYNVGSTEEVSILELARRVKQFTESRSALQLVPYEQAYAKGFEDMRRRAPSIDKIYQLMGWRPTKNLNEILQLTVGYERATSPPN